MQQFAGYLKASAMIVALTLCGSAQADENVNWTVQSRELPPPGGASEALRNNIAAALAPNVASHTNYPKNRAEWDTVIAQRAAARKIDIAALEHQTNVSIKRDVIAGVKVYRIEPNTPVAAHAKHLFIYLHGGAYVFGGGDSSVGEAAVITASTGIPSVAIDYRMPPDHSFPAALDDVVAVYKKILEDHSASSLAIGGTSAGGGLSLAAVHKFKALNLPVPGAIYGGTPWADLTKTSDTLYTNEGIDRVLVTYDGALQAAALLYANGTDLTDPLLSPVYGDFSGFPPTYLVTGTRDMFLSDTARTHRKLRTAGVIADLNVYEGISHAEYIIMSGSPEFQQTYKELGDFLRKHLQN